MRRDEWQRAFGGTPRAFESRVQDALNNLQEEKKVKKKLSLTISIALAAVLALAGTAFAVANGMGIVDFLDRFGMASDSVASVVEPVQGDSVSTGRVRYTAQEAVFDGTTLQLTVVCEPLEPDRVMLVGVDEQDEDVRLDNGDSVPLTGAPGDSATQTVRAYAEQNGLELVRAEATLPLDGCGMEYASRDGRLYYYMRGTFAPDERPEPDPDGMYHLTVTVCDSCCAEDATEAERATLEVAVAGKAAQDRQSLTFDAPIDMGTYTIDRIDVDLTRQETTLRLQYTLHDDLTEAQLRAFESLTFEMMKDGTSLEALRGWGGGTTPVDGETPEAAPGDAASTSETASDGLIGRTFLATLTYDPLEAVPEHFYIRPYDFEKGAFGDVIVLNASDAAR